MKEAIVHGGDPMSVKIVDIPIPSPKDDEVLIKVVYSGSNPKDWKYPLFAKTPRNSGDDIAGYVEKVGKDVYEFQKGDKVAAFHVMNSPSGSFAEYAVSPAHTVFHLPESADLAEAATIPLAAMTAAIGLYDNLQLPAPWDPATKPTPLIVYGASGAVGAFAVKLAVRSNVHPIIAVAGKGQDFVKSIIDTSKGDAVVDYRDGPEKLVEGIKNALKKAGISEVMHAYDAISEKGSPEALSKVLASGAKLTFVLPNLDFSSVRQDIVTSITYVGLVHTNVHSDNDTVRYVGAAHGKDFGYVYFRYLGQGLKDGWFKGHPVEVVPGGLEGVAGALQNLRDGKASAVKYVFKIEDTP